MIGARYFPHGSPISVHTSIRTLRVSYPYVRARGLRWTARAGPLRLAAAATARRALARDQLVEHPAPVLLRSALVLLRVLPRDLMTCRHRQPLTHPPSTPQRPKQDPGFASSSPVRHAPHFASTLGESRRRGAAGGDAGVAAGSGGGDGYRVEWA